VQDALTLNKYGSLDLSRPYGFPWLVTEIPLPLISTFVDLKIFLYASSHLNFYLKDENMAPALNV
jgi:hypothetical protein